jgi:hypothetical protein
LRKHSTRLLNRDEMDTPLTSPTWANVFTFLSGVATGLILLLAKVWADSKKTRIEIVETASRAELNVVTARSTELRDDIATGEGVGRMLGNLIQTGDQLYDLQQQVFELKGRMMRAEADAAAAQLYVDQLNMAAKLRGVKLSDFLPRELNPPK